MQDITIREARPSDEAAIQRCMLTVFRETAAAKTTFGPELWRWQYRADGPRSVVIVAEDGGDLCGYYHVLLMPMAWGDGRFLAGLVQDVGVLPGYRGRGIFRQMGTLALQRMQALDVELAFAFPNPRSLHSFTHDHGYSVAGEVPLYVSPIDAGAAAAARFPGAAGILPTRLLRIPARIYGRIFLSGPPGRGLTISQVSATDQRLPSVAVGDARKLRVERTADYFRWRFEDHPTVQYQIWSAGGIADLNAYVVTRTAHLFSMRCLVIMDCAHRAGCADALRALLRARLRAAQSEQVALGVVVGLNEFTAGALRLGFVRVPPAASPRRMVLVVKRLAQSDAAVLQAKMWMLAFSDWDVF